MPGTMPERQMLDDVLDTLNVLYVGPQGHGKTTAMAMLSHLGRVVYIDMEGGLKKVALKRLGVRTDNIERYVPRSYDEFEGLYWDCAERLAQDPMAITGICIDSVTDQQEKFLETSVIDRVAKEASKPITKQNPEVLNPHWTSRDDYGIWTNQARKLTRKFRDLPTNVAFGTLERREVSSAGVKLVPQLTQAYRTSVLGYVDIVAHMVTAENPYSPNADGIEYLGIMRGVGMFSGKDRFGLTPRVLANPSMDRLIAIIYGELDLDNDPHQQAYLKRMAEKTGQAAPSVAQAADTVQAKEEDTKEEDS